MKGVTQRKRSVKSVGTSGPKAPARALPRPQPAAGNDFVAVEEPLEIRVAQDTVAITMRTPGDDEKLALGFLYAEGVIKGHADVGAAAYCGRPGEEGYGNVIEVTPASGAWLSIEKLEPSRRGTLTTSACGVCGRKSVDDLMKLVGDVPEGPVLDERLIASGPTLLRMAQPNFAMTGGVHAAVIVSQSGEVLSSAEDVGRHNAVDKAVGALIQKGAVPARRGAGEPALLFVSGRASFEIIQKAAMAKLAAVASVSAASSLAIDLADRAGLTLVTFMRDGHFNICTHPQRIGASV